MKFHGRVAIQGIVNPLTFVEVSNGRVRYVKNGRECFNLEASEITLVNFQPKGVSQLLGYGTVTVSHAGTSHEIPNMNDGSGLKKAIESSRKSNRKIPDSELEDFVVMIPKPETDIYNLGNCYSPEVCVKVGSFIEKGTTLGKFGWPIKSPIAGKVCFAGVGRAPTSWKTDINWPLGGGASGGLDQQHFVTNLHDAMLVAVRPRKGEYVSDAVQVAYSDYLAQAKAALEERRKLSRDQLVKMRFTEYVTENPKKYWDLVEGLLLLMEKAKPRFFRASESVENTNHKMLTEVLFDPSREN